MSSSEEATAAHAPDNQIGNNEKSPESSNSAEVEQQPPAKVKGLDSSQSTSEIPPTVKGETSLDLSSLKDAVEAPSDHTPTSVYIGLNSILADAWSEEDIADLVRAQFGDSVGVYKKEGDCIDSFHATIFAFHFLHNESGKHHILYHSKDQVFMRTKILHYFVPFNGPYLCDAVQKSIFQGYFYGKRQSMKDSNGNWVSYANDEEYQKYVNKKVFPLSAYVSYNENQLVSHFGYTLVAAAPNVESVKQEQKEPAVKPTA